MQDGNNDPPRARTEVVSAGESGQRVDNFLLKRASGVPRSHIYQIIRKGRVLVNGRRVKPTRKLVEGEHVRIPPLAVTSKPDVRVPDDLAQRLAGMVVLEHEDFLALNKPSGIAVHGGTGLAFGAIDALRQQFDDPDLELVHRLDRGTSGCLLIARDLGRCRELQTLFRERQVEKRYEALVSGVWKSQKLTIDAPLAKNVEHAGERRVIVQENGQSAVTHFVRKQRFVDATLLDITIETGRTHQIRVHAKHAGHAVVGDTRYGDNVRNRAFRRRGLSRLFLHSSRLEFSWKGKQICIDVPPDEHWLRDLSKLQIAGEA